MKIFLALVLVVLAANCAHKKIGDDGRTPASANLIPLRDFFKQPLLSGYTISPDGKYLAWMAPYRDRRNIFIQPRDNSAPARQLTKITDRDISDYNWKSDHTILFFRDFDGDENTQIFSVDVRNDRVTALTPFPGVKAQVVDGLLDDDDHILISLNRRDKQYFDVFRLNVLTGELVEVQRNPGDVIAWVTDNSGRVRMAISSNGVDRTLRLVDEKTGEFRDFIKTDFKTTVSPQGFTPDNKLMYALSNRGRDKQAFVTIDLTTGAETVIYERSDVDIAGFSRSNLTKKPLTINYNTDKVHRHYVDPQWRLLREEMEKNFPGMSVSVVDQDKAETIFIIAAGSDVHPGAYYIFDSIRHSFQKLSIAMPWIDSDKMSFMTPIQYKSRDGLTIHGYLTVPRGMEAKNLPIIVHPHGGPWTRDNWGYNAAIQFLASRGFAVLQMNYRGSTGYGRKFWQASFKQWGRKMQDDITDGVKWLIDQKIADPKRIAIYGGSYGGYATLAGLTFTPDLYACGIDYVGVSNIFTWMEAFPSYWLPLREMVYEQVGDPEKDRELLLAISPAFHVDKIRAPLFVAQGAKDPRVPLRESDQVVQALRERGVEVEYMVKDNEGQGFHNQENVFDFYEAMERFLYKHL